MATLATMTSLDSKLNELLSWSCTCSNCSEIGREVKKLYRTGKRICALLCDAEEREIWDESIKLWLNELRDVAYDAEDVVEDVHYQLLRCRCPLVCEEGEHDQTTHEERGSKGKRQVSESHNTPPCPALHDASFQQQIIAKIKEINNQFDEIYKDKVALKLGKNDAQRYNMQNMMERPPSSSVLGNSHVYGRDADKDSVVDVLLSSQSHEHGAENVSVVSIVGMGGIGKTTLARQVYNDDRVKNHFEVRAWVCVSDSFDPVRLTKEILEAVTGDAIGLQGFSPLQEKLQERLKGKIFLVVLDDLWNERREQWDVLWGPLSSGAAGSKVLVTTRNEEVSRTSRAISVHRPEVLSVDDCWSLFAECAFGCKNTGDHPELVSIGKEIVRKCGGLPLAIRTLGGMLFDESDEERWNDILKSNIWELPEEKNDILPALKLSYQHLPSLLKPCFAFCAVFPKGGWFWLKELVSFWMALGYITPIGGRCMEDIGRSYVEDLQQRSFLIHDDGGWLEMHDLIHDLACSVGGKLFDDASWRKFRHVSISSEADVTTLLSCRSTNEFRYLRTFYLTDTFSIKTKSVLCSEVLDDMFQRMRHLRVLCLCGVPLSQLPDSVGNLKHLRYLRIWGDGLSSLPETLGNLLCLQTLIVNRAFTLKELPGTLGNLRNLRRLEVTQANTVKKLLETLGNLRNLQTLTVSYLKH